MNVYKVGIIWYEIRHLDKVVELQPGKCMYHLDNQPNNNFVTIKSERLLIEANSLKDALVTASSWISFQNNSDKSIIGIINESDIYENDENIAKKKKIIKCISENAKIIF